MAERTLLQRLIGWFGEFVEWAHEVLTGELSRRAIIADLGGNPDAAGTAEFPPPQLASIAAYRDAAEPTLEGLIDAVNDVRSFFASVRSVVQALNIGGWATNDELVRALIDLLASNYVRLRYPRIYFLMQVVSFTEETTSVYGDGRHNYGRFVTGLGHVLEFVLGPLDTWNLHLADEADARRQSDRSWQVLAALFAFWKRLGADDVLYGADLAPGQPDFDDPTAVDRALARMLTLKFGRSTTGSELDHDEAVLGSLAWVPETQGGPALFMSLGGKFHFDGAINERWHLLTEMSSASAVNFMIGGEAGFKCHVPGAEPAAFRAGIALEARPDALSGLSYDLSPLRGTGIQFGLIRLEASFTEQAAQVRTIFRDAALTLSPKAFDNFLGRLLPSDGLRVGFDFAIGHASDRGSFLEGQVPTVGTGAASPRPPAPAPAPPGSPPPLPTLPRSQSQAPGLSLRIPIGKALGPVTIHDLQLGVAKSDSTYLGEVTTAVSARLGPVTARIERVGLRLAVRLPAEDDSSANLGLLDLDVGPRPPDGIALAIDARGVLTGGGFLFHDRAQALYAGVMQLSLRERITLKAFGLLATRLPDGSPGYSLIVFITAEDFRPYPLGMGFMLRGIGGMLAVNRTFDQAAMREGLKNNTLANLLFPRDPIRRAPEILASLATVFPARTGSYLFGPLARITWGTPVMVVLELALILEFGNRTRLIVLGRISSLLPSRENDLVRLNVDALGLIDFDEGRAEIDAVLVDSRLAHKFVLTGAMALRIRWTSGPGTGFALAVGGLNPHFAPPAGFPKLDRVTIALASGDNPRITCAAYIAITSNTLQFGARAALYAAAGGFSIQGDVGFDVLIVLVPFHFLAEFHASIQLKRGSRNLFKVAVQGVLEGPRPLRVSAKATFEILWCDFSVRFDKTLVSGERPPPPPAIDALAELRRALAEPGSWSAEMPGGVRQTVVLREPPASSATALPALHPLGRLSVKQALLPLNTARDIDSFGGAPVHGERRFRVTAVTLNGDPQSTSPLSDLFAPAQFFDLTDEEKIASPSFETMDGGVAFGSDAIEFAASESVDAPLVYEAIVIDPAGPATPAKSDYTLPPDRLGMLAHLGAVATAPVRTSCAARFRRADAAPAVELKAPVWTIASTDELKPRAATAATPATWTTWIEARAAMRAVNRVDGGGAAKWQLIRDFEAVA